jgi:hypothetical protein
VGRASDGDDDQHRARDRQVGIRAAERVAHRLDPDGGIAPIVDRVERAVEGDEEADVEELHEHQKSKHGPEQPRDESAGAARQHDDQQDDDDPFEREPHEGAGCETPRLVRSDEGDPHHDEGEQRERDRPAATVHANRSASRGGGVPVPPQPPDVTAERFREERERDREDGAGRS